MISVLVYRYKCPAKINLSLSILKRDEASGLHFLDSVIAKIDLYDELKLMVSQRSGLTLKIFKEVTDPIGTEALEKENTILKAYNKLNEELDYPLPGLSVELRKRIPVGTGLGGASSDAAGFIKLIYFLAKKTSALPEKVSTAITNLDSRKIEKIAFEVGADVPALLKDGTVRIRGFGEMVEKVSFPGLKEYRVVLAVPKIRFSTEEMYKNLQSFSGFNCTVDFIENWGGQGIEQAFMVARNDFEEIAFSKSAEVKSIVNFLKSAEFPFVSLTGSGSAVYALEKQQNPLPVAFLPSGEPLTRHNFII